jgi:hypothetical protein
MRVFVHDNHYEKETFAMPDLTRELGQLISIHNANGPGQTQDIIYDGIWDQSISTTIESNPMEICIQEKGIENLNFTRFYLMEGEENIESFKDYHLFQNCKVEVKTNNSGLAGL